MVQKTVLVTGSTGGIGAAVVEALAGLGWRVFACGRSTEKLEALQTRVPDVVTVGLDLAAIGDGVPALDAVDRLEGLVHCAGVADVAPVEETDAADWDAVFAANVIGPALLTRDLLPALRAGRGRVIFVNAAPGLRGVPRWSAYLASKAALRELADSLREEERAHGLRVTSMYPGGVRTELLRTVREQLGVPYDPTVTISPQTLASLVAAILAFPDDAEIMDVSLRAALPADNHPQRAG
jgi:NAD(P)-dependent dehydrogenase (short-subunit alcohol dehydrogenase family)